MNLLALLGWNNGTEKELFSLEELINEFSIERVHKSGAKFDYEKAKWFNHEWIKKSASKNLFNDVKAILESKEIHVSDDEYLNLIIDLVKDRCTLMTDFYDQSFYFFKAPVSLDLDAVKPKWNNDKNDFFSVYCNQLNNISEWNVTSIEEDFKKLATEKNIKPGELQLPMRIMLVGGKFGPAVFEIANKIGKEETIKRIQNALVQLN